jgi:hypothetical protein
MNRFLHQAFGIALYHRQVACGCSWEFTLKPSDYEFLSVLFWKGKRGSFHDKYRHCVKYWRGL